jgi:hypothetical protein
MCENIEFKEDKVKQEMKAVQIKVIKECMALAFLSFAHRG